MIMKRLLIIITTLSLAATVVGASNVFGKHIGPSDSKPNSRDAKAIVAIRAVLDTQVAAWNRGDIQGFMDGYARSDDIVFISGDSLTHGWQTVLDRYKKGYDTREKMGTLLFSELAITVIGKDAAVATGRWQLTREKDMPRGRFTLIFRRRPEGWRIVHDHTSSAP